MSDLDAAVAALRKVDYFASLEEDTLRELARRGTRVRYRTGERVVSELEAGADVFVVLEGRAELSVEPRAGERQVLDTIEAGHAFGEMSSLTGELRSATVTALTPLTVLRLADADFDDLRTRRPRVAVALVRILAQRLAGRERAIEALLAEPAGPHGAAATVARKAGAEDARGARGSLRRAWRELVVSRKRDVGFLCLSSFVLTLLAIRAAVFFAFRYQMAPRAVLRFAYTGGFGLLGLSAAVALLTFRIEWRRAIGVAYGVGLALIFNSLGVTLAFDIFYRDIHTPDPNVPFDLERLYRRTEPARAIVLGLLVLLQAAYLRHFYRRAWFVLRVRTRRLFGGRA